MGTLSSIVLPLFYKHLVCDFFIKILVFISISKDIHRPYIYDPLGSYISLVNNSIDSNNILLVNLYKLSTSTFSLISQ